MKCWSISIALLFCFGCDHGSDPIRRVPPDRYDGSFFDARRPFDPANPRKPGAGYGSGQTYGATYEEESETAPSERIASDEEFQPDANLNTLPDAGLNGGEAMENVDDNSGGVLNAGGQANSG